MNVAYPGPWAQISEADALLMDVARRIRLSKTKYETAETNFRALCQHVDREGSPLQGKVVECYPSGSFATGTAIASRVAKNQHDVDVVIELDVPSDRQALYWDFFSKPSMAIRTAATTAWSRRTAAASP